jgi:hypothetical protein
MPTSSFLLSRWPLFLLSIIHSSIILKALHDYLKSSISHQSQHLRAHRVKTICMGSDSIVLCILSSRRNVHNTTACSTKYQVQLHCQSFDQLCCRGLPEHVPSTMAARLGALERPGRHQTVQMVHIVFSNLHRTRGNSGKRYALKVAPGSGPPQDLAKMKEIEKTTGANLQDWQGLKTSESNWPF